MDKLVNSIIKDIKENLKPFVLIFSLFFVVLYLGSLSERKKIFSLNSEMILSEPKVVNGLTNFNKKQYKEDLLHYFLEQKTKNKINEICILDNLEQVSDMAFDQSGFQYIKLSMFHNKPINNKCINSIFNQIVLNHFDKYLTNITDINEKILEYMKRKTYELDQTLFLSSFKDLYVAQFRDAYQRPELIKIKINSPVSSSDLNFVKIITISFIFSALISIFISALQKKYKRNNKKGSKKI